MIEASETDLTTRAGLLMEAAQAQQRFGQECLQRLQAHLRDLDTVVRDEIHHTLIDALAGLVEETTQAAQALRRMQHMVGLRLVSWTAVVTVIGVLLGLGAVWQLLPSPRQIAALRARRDALAVEIARLEKYGGGVDLRKCGAHDRLCVRVDRRGPAYGADGDFLLVKGS